MENWVYTNSQALYSENSVVINTDETFCLPIKEFVIQLPSAL